MGPLTTWLGEHPPPASLAIEAASSEGPFRTAPATIRIRRRAPWRPPSVPAPPPPPRKETLMLRVVRVVASGCIYVGATGLHLPLLGLGAAGLALSFVDLRRERRLQLPPGSAELVLGARELRVDDHEVIALAEIGGSDDRDFTLRVMLVRDQRFSRWATVWYGPEDERRWIGQLVSAAIAAARAA